MLGRHFFIIICYVIPSNVIFYSGTVTVVGIIALMNKECVII